MIRILMIMFFLMSFSAQAEWAVTGGVDIKHDKGETYADLRYLDMFDDDEPDFGLGWSTYVATTSGVGVELFWRESNVEVGLGAEYSDYDEGMVETLWKYQVRFGYNFTEQWSVQLVHKSNCSYICRDGSFLDFLPHGPRDKANNGYNFLSAQYRW